VEQTDRHAVKAHVEEDQIGCRLTNVEKGKWSEGTVGG